MEKERFVETGRNSFFGDYLYDLIVPEGHFLRELRQVIPWEHLPGLLSRKYLDGVFIYAGTSRRFCNGQAGYRGNLRVVILSPRFRHIELDEFVIMPNHIHGIIIISANRRGTAGDVYNHEAESSRRAHTIDVSWKRISPARTCAGLVN